MVRRDHRSSSFCRAMCDILQVYVGIVVYGGIAWLCGVFVAFVCGSHISFHSQNRLVAGVDRECVSTRQDRLFDERTL